MGILLNHNTTDLCYKRQGQQKESSNEAIKEREEDIHVTYVMVIFFEKKNNINDSNIYEHIILEHDNITRENEEYLKSK